VIIANDISVSGSVTSNGAVGVASPNDAGASGGGSGGSILFQTKNAANLGTNLVTSTGGAGGGQSSMGGGGGSGGVGRIAVQYAGSLSGSANPAVGYSNNVGFFPYGLYHSTAIPTANSTLLDNLRWEANLPANTKVEFQTRTGNSTDPTDGTWEDWLPFTDGTNFTMLEDVNTASNWPSSNLNVDDTGVARDVDFFEDDDETTAANNTKFTTTGFEEDTGATLTTSLISYWPLNETSTGVAQVNRADAFGSNTLTDNNTTASGTGKKGNTADFESANSEFLNIIDNASLSTGDIDFTVAAWVNLESKAASQALVGKHDSATVREYTLYYASSTDTFSLIVWNAAGTEIGRVDATSLGSPATGTWYFVVAWHNATTDTISIKVNNGTTDSVATTGVLGDTGARFSIGAQNTNTGGTLFADGLIDEVGFWKKVLSSTEITDLYDSGNANTYPASGQYAEATPAGSPVDISGYDYLTLWVRASQAGTVLRFGFGEAAATEQTEDVTIDTTNTWQKVYWDLSDVAAASRNAVTKLRITNLTTASNTFYLDNVRAEKLMTNLEGTQITSTPNNYFQYRVILTTTDTSAIPEVENVSMVYNSGYRISQPDDDTVRLYNYTGEEQNVRLEAIVFGADLAEWYPTSDNSIEAGDVVSIAGIKDDAGVPKIQKATTTSDPKIMGIISTKAGIELGIPREDRRLVGLAGRVPVKIAPDSAPIQAGDLLTSSGTYPGMAQKLTQPGFAVAKALEDWTCDRDTPCQAKIEAFLAVSWADPGVVVDQEGDAAQITETPPPTEGADTEGQTTETDPTPTQETSPEPEPTTQKILPPKVEADEGIFQRLTVAIEAVFEKITIKIAQIAEAFIQKLTVESLAVKGKSIGQVVIEPGETEHAVEYPDLTKSSKVFFTLDRAVAVGVEKTVGKDFKFILATPTDLPITIDYWVVEQ